MTAEEFLREVLPAKGPYCIAPYPYTNKQGKKVPHLKGFDRIEDAAAYAMTMRDSKDVYFSTHSMKCWYTDPHGRKYLKRGSGHQGECQVFYWDGDVKLDDPEKYPSKKAVIEGLAYFLETTKLPMPMLIDSGNGVHGYFLLSSPLSSEVWKEYAEKFKAVCKYYRFRVDPLVTADLGRILRVVGTYNRKDINRLKPVVCRERGVRIDTNVFCRMIDELYAAIPKPEAQAVDREDESRDNATKPTIEEVAGACGAFKQMLKTSHNHDEPRWFAMIQIDRGIRDGMSWAEQFSARHPSYQPGAVAAKLKHVIDQGIGLPSCAYIGEKLYPEACAKCWFKGKEGGNPIRAALAKPLPQIADEVPMPVGFQRVKAGIQYMPPGEKPPQVISHYDMKPIDIVDDVTTETKVVEWDVTYPLTGVRRIRLPIDIHASPRMLSTLANRGILIQLSDQKILGRFMSTYLRQLQEHRRETALRTTLGWLPGYKEFVLADGVYSAQGKVRAMLSPQLQAIAAKMTRGGTLDAQVAAMRFYAHPEYVAHQFALLGSLAAPLFYLTGHAGAIINIVGETGVSKTTMLMGAAAFWGSRDFAMNGSSQGSTYKGKMNRIYILANLPMLMDEITLMEPEQARAFVLDVSQGQPRIGLTVAGVEKTVEANQQSTIAVTTSNKSLHELLAQDNQSGAAGSMRVLETEVGAVGVHTKAEADEFLDQIRKNHGWIGPVFMEYVVQHLPEIEAEFKAIRAEVLRRTEGKSHERFWIDVATCVILAGRIAVRLGLLAFDMDYLTTWVVDVVLPEQRSLVSDSYLDPMQSLLVFMEKHQGNFIKVIGDRVRPGTFYLAPDVTQPGSSTALLGRYEMEEGRLYITAEGFRRYCQQHRLPHHRTVKMLIGSGLVDKVRYTLGKGIAEYSTGQVDMLRVDMRHELVSGQARDMAERKVVQLPVKKAGQGS